MRKSSILIVLISLFLIPFAFAQQSSTRTPQNKPAVTEPQSSGKFSGMIFSDYSFIFADPTSNNNINGFGIRRATLGYDHSFHKDLSARIVFDANDTTAILQEGFVKIENLIPMVGLKMGRMQTFASENVDKIFGYRSLGKMVLNRQSYALEFDNGIAFLGKINPSGSMYVNLMVGNGANVANKNKKIYLSIGNWLDKFTIAEVYADYENVGSGKSSITARGFFGMTAQQYAFGVEGFYRMDRKFAGTKDITPAGASLFAWYESMKGLRGVARVDVLDNDLNSGGTLANPSYRELYINLGVDFFPSAEIHIIPNIAYVKNLKKGTSPEYKDYMEGRLTAAVYFPSFK